MQLCRMSTRVLPFATVFALLLAQRAAATVTITDCNTDPHCVARGKKTVIAALNDTIVIADAIAPLTGTETIQIKAHAIAVDGSAGGSITATGKGRSIVLDAASILVTGGLHSLNNNGKVYLRGVDTVQTQSPAVIDASDGQARFVCTGLACTIAITGAHIHANFLFVDALGDVIWNLNIVDLQGPRDQAAITSEGGSIKKTGAIQVALAGGRLAAEPAKNKVDAVSEALSFCEGCSTTPTPTPTPHSRTATPTRSRTPTPTAPLQTASLPLGTPSPTRTDPNAPTPTPTPGACCNTITGSSESNVTLTALNDIDASNDHYLVAENITLSAGGTIDLTNAELRNDFGKCGEIVVTAGGQVNIQGATLVDDDCRNQPDVSSVNGREEVPHTGFNDVVGTTAVDD